MMTLTALAEFTRVRLTLVCDPPDATGGWSAQFQRRLLGTTTWVSHGSRDSSPPFSRAAEVASGTYDVQAILTKSGQPTVTYGPARIVATAAPVTVTWNPNPPDPPIDCVWGPWSAWSGWSPNGDGTESRTRTRSIAVHESNGGAPCTGPSTEKETRQIDAPPPPPPPPPPGPVLTAADLTYLGVITMPFDDPGGAKTRWGTAMGGLTFRRVGSELRFFTTGGVGGALGDYTGNKASVYEVRSNGIGQRATLVRNWGDVTKGKKELTTEGQNNYNHLYDLHWDGSKLWWCYGSVYTSGAVVDPSVGVSTLNDSSGAVLAYGPWRCTENSQRTKGMFITLPQAFADAYCGGNRIALSAPVTAQNGFGPRGATCYVLPTFDPLTLPADTLGNQHVSLALKRVLHSDAANPQPRNTNYRLCGWNVFYDPAQGGWLQPGDPTWNNGSFALDCLTSGVWVKTPTKEGLVFFGQVTGVVPGHDYSYPGNPGETLPHMQYGPDNGSANGGKIKCVHGQTMSPTSGTGPKTGSLVGVLQIFDPATLAQAAAGTIPAHGIAPREEVRLNTLHADFPAELMGDYRYKGAIFDPADNRLYVVDIYGETIGETRPVIRVFQVR